MRSVQIHEFGEPSVLKIEAVPDLQPGPNQVLIENKAIGINPVDTYIRAGKYGPRTFPHTLGLDAAGVVKRIGELVKEFAVGDRVYVHGGGATGAYAEEMLAYVPQVHALADRLSFAQGAAIGAPYMTAYYALTLRARAQKGETVFIHGASGGVGTATLQYARALGLTVIGSAGSPKGLEHVTAQGAHHAINHKEPNYLDELMKFTEGRGADIIVEMLASVNLGNDLKVVAKNGRVVVVGSRGTVTIDPRDTMSRNASILGMSIMNALPADSQEAFTAIQLGITRHHLTPVVGQEFLLADVAKAHEAVLAPGALGKIILRP